MGGKKEWLRRVVVTVALAGLCGMLVWVTGIRGSSIFSILFVLLVFSLELFRQIYILPDRPKKLLPLSGWKKPAILVALYGAALTAIIAALTFVPFLNPQGSTESVPGRIEGNTNGSLKFDRENNEILKQMQNKNGTQASIRQKIVGIWGEPPNCIEVSYRFLINGNALKIKSERRPNGSKAYDENAHIEGAGNNELTSSAVEDGQGANFRLETIADTDWLIWTTRGERPSPLRLMRCDK